MLSITFDSKDHLFQQIAELGWMPEAQTVSAAPRELSAQELLDRLQAALPDQEITLLPKKRGPGRPKGSTKAAAAAAKPAPEPVAPPEPAPAAETPVELSPEDAMKAAMDILTPMYNDAVGKEAVLKLRDQFNVKKFALLPKERAHELLDAAQKLAEVIVVPDTDEEGL
jgi:hypothetical protein